MHIVKFKGGFANQLFQLSLYEKLIEMYGSQKVFADIAHYNYNHNHGGFKLDKFFKFQYIKKMPDKYTIINELSFHNTIISEKVDYLYNGYWQGEDFLPAKLDYLDTIFDESRLNDANKDVLRAICCAKSISVHVRRGDYIDNYMHGNIATLAYYKNAILYLNEEVKDAVYFCFSDDIEWCKKTCLT